MSSALSLRLFFATAAFSSLVACVGDSTPKGESYEVTPPGTLDGDGGAGNDSGGPVTPPNPCDPNASPVPTCQITESYGVFVSSTLGSDEGDGTRAKPLKTLAAAIASATPTKKRVYACAETYAETVTLVDGVSLFGYFDCASSWAVTTQKLATLAAPTSPAMTAKNLVTTTRVEGFTIVAPKAVAAGGSSLGLLVDHAAPLSVAKSRIEVGDAADGTDGTAPEAYRLTSTDGSPVKFTAGALEPRNYDPIEPVTYMNQGQCSLPDGTNSGLAVNQGGLGFAANHRAIWNSGSNKWVLIDEDPNATYARLNAPLTDITKNAPGANYWRAGVVTNKTPAAAGGTGANGANGTSGGPLGKWQADGTYLPASGTDGLDGAVGLGGGGGMGWLPPNQGNYTTGIYVGSGAQGGIGGCPGRAGTAGTGGGASVGVLAFESAFSLRDTVIVAGRGGRGGAGSPGSAPTVGTSGGAAENSLDTMGAMGGSGGSAGASGHGGSGPSFGIAYVGAKPNAVAVDAKPAVASEGRPEIGATGAKLPATPAGLAEGWHAL